MGDTIKVRVRYSEVDNMGFVYYARYLEYFEMARTEYIRMRGRTYREIEKDGFLLPVTEVWVKYRKAAVYDDLLTIETEVTWIKKASMEFHYYVRNNGGDILSEGTTKHALLDQKGKISSFPEDIRQKLLTT